jgi:hypothetical protein
MFTVTSTMTRPSTSSPWWLDSPSLVNEGNVIREFQSDPLVLALSEVGSPDGLTLTRNFTYNSYNDYQNWISKVTEADPTIFANRNEYIVNNGHTLKIEESLDGGPKVVEKLL